MVVAALVMVVGVLALAATTLFGEASPGTNLNRFGPIRHIVILVRENRSFNEMFGRMAGVDGTRTGTLPNGRTVHSAAPPTIACSIAHSGISAQRAVDNGRMDGFSLLPGAIQDNFDVSLTQYREPQIPNYWAYARHFTLDDHFFSTILGASFPNHLVTLAATSANTNNNPVNNLTNTWGCDSGRYSRVETVNPFDWSFEVRQTVF